MVELFFLLLLIGCGYCWKTGKFSKEYQAKQKEKSKQEWAKLKSEFKQFTQRKKQTQQQKIDLEINGIRQLGKTRSSSGANHYNYSPEFSITYTDSNDNVSLRDIAVIKRYKNGGSYYIDAYCFEAQDRRTFRIDRINSVKVIKTGQSVASENEIIKLFFNA